MNTVTKAHSPFTAKKCFQGPVCAVLIGFSGAIFAQEAVQVEKPAMDKGPAVKQDCLAQAIIDQAQKAGGCEVEKGDNYTKISAADHIVALLAEKIVNADRCQEVLATVKAKCAGGGDQLTPEERTADAQQASGTQAETVDD